MKTSTIILCNPRALTIPRRSYAGRMLSVIFLGRGSSPFAFAADNDNDRGVAA